MFYFHYMNYHSINISVLRNTQYVFGRALFATVQQSIITHTNQMGGEMTSFASYL